MEEQDVIHADIVSDWGKGCINCKHYPQWGVADQYKYIDEDTWATDTMYCLAFPFGVPEEILSGDAGNHTKPRPDLGQKNDIVYEIEEYDDSETWDEYDKRQDTIRHSIYEERQKTKSRLQ